MFLLKLNISWSSEPKYDYLSSLLPLPPYNEPSYSTHVITDIWNKVLVYPFQTSLWIPNCRWTSVLRHHQVLLKRNLKTIWTSVRFHAVFLFNIMSRFFRGIKVLPIKMCISFIPDHPVGSTLQVKISSPASARAVSMKEKSKDHSNLFVEIIHNFFFRAGSWPCGSWD